MSLVKKEQEGVYAFFCIGCGEKHVYYTQEAKQNISWQYNGNPDAPTFTPSLLNRWGKHANPEWEEPEGEAPEHGWSGTCHLFITNGQIIYCGDSTHALAGQTVDMIHIQ